MKIVKKLNLSIYSECQQISCLRLSINVLLASVNAFGSPLANFFLSSILASISALFYSSAYLRASEAAF